MELKSISTKSSSSFCDSNYNDRSLSIYSADSYSVNTEDSPIPYSESTTCDKGSPIHYNGKIINFKDTCFENQQVDIIYYNDKYIILLRNGNFILENKSSKRTIQVISPIIMIKINVFNGYIYGLSEGILYKLDMTTFCSPVWDWVRINDMVQNVIHVSATLNMEHLWAQTGDNKGYLFDCKLEIIEETNINEKTYRIYGMNKKNWVEVDGINHTATLYPSNYMVHNVYDAGLAHDNKVVISEDPNRLVKIVNWKVAYPYRPGMLPDVSC